MESTARRFKSWTVTLSLILLGVLWTTGQAAPIGTGFSYQGVLKDGGVPANGNYDFIFRLFDDAQAGSQVGSDVNLNGVTVADGLFSVELDFGAVFDGTEFWLEIEVGGAVLGPRQKLTPTPYALYSAAPGAGSTELQVLTAQTIGDPNSQPRQLFATATCPPGKVIFGGGAHLAVVEALLSAQDGLAIQASYPSDCTGSPLRCTSWTAIGAEGSSVNGTWSVTAYAICGNP